MKDFILILNSFLLITYTIAYSYFKTEVKSGKEFKLDDSLYKCEKIRELTELEK